MSEVTIVQREALLKAFSFFILSLLFTQPVVAQSGGQNMQDRTQRTLVEGTIVDAETQEPLVGANVALFALPDTVLVRGATSMDDGSFALRMTRPGTHLLQVSFIGYFTQIESLEWTGEEDLPFTRNFALTLNREALDEVRITGRMQRMEIRGDTTAFNADAFTTGRDATVEDLIQRMPGIVVQDGRVEAQGEQVRRVLVDGNEFFGDDATMAIRNLPAEVVSQIEVFDRMGEQARFTGFDDGSQERTINIVTRMGIRNGQFGRFNSGYGSEDRYNAGGNYNYFSGARRISVLGMTNNVNQQNFSGDDLSGVQAASMRRPGMGLGAGRAGGWGGGATRDFLVGQQDGITTTHAFGLNYIDRPSQQLNINSSYFFNAADNDRERTSERRYTGGFFGNQLYDEFSGGVTDNFNHRFNARVEYNMSEQTSFIFTPRLNVQQNSSNSFLDAETFNSSGLPLNETLNQSTVDLSTYDMSGSLLWRQRFDTPGRTLSVNFQGDTNNRTGDQGRIGTTIFFDPEGNEIIDDQNQRTDISDNGYTLGTTVTWTERASERVQLQFSYNPSFSVDKADRRAFSFNEITEAYDIPDVGLSNAFENEIWRQRVSSGMNFRRDSFRLNVTLAYQNTLLRGDQVFPVEASTRQVYHNLLPSANANFNTGENQNMFIRYNTNTRTPSANQLQNVIDNSNPVQLSGGNPALEQQYTHSLMTRWRRTNPQTGSSMVFFVMGNYTLNTIGNETFIAQRDSTLPGNVFFGAGSRLTLPDNVGDSWSVRAFAARGLVWDLIRSNVNFNAGATFNSTPTAINGQRFTAETWSLNSGFVASSNISPEIDFRISYQANYNITDNSVPTGFDSNYYVGTAAFRFNVQPWRGLFFESDTRIRHLSGLDDAFNNDVIFWNLGLGYRFLNDRAAELKFTVIDVLNQNDNINRIIEDTFVEDVRSNVLSRYAMVTFTYNFRAIQQGGQPQRPGMAPGMRGDWRQ
ncbi:Fe transport outer membrane receptor protein [Cyclonatronum proteinivorum]|uniref:Fe transport outer membrane receptor protein n=1 Tax=Cyclonatronum proteinivorum TaxID=1457365 RepID=A0A345UJZ7_9BACT|nr:outer membrane beta-barrel protein [Cyclonatronum proteinivorum]AXJ00799.1 Fe transport outer membrane receptor protein [Cyclonatronum proteinivorum]